MNLVAELHVPNFTTIKEFYQSLGFRIVWERQPDGEKGYLVMEIEGNVLCFWPGTEEVFNQSYFKQFPRNTVRGYGVELVLQVKDVNRLYQAAKSLGAVVEDMMDRPWGLTDFRIADPYGYYLRFTTPHDILDSNYAVK